MKLKVKSNVKMSDSAAKHLEKLHNQVLFNDVVDKHFKRDVETEEELEKAVKIVKNLQISIRIDEGVLDVELSKMTEAELHNFYVNIIRRYFTYASRD